MPSRIGDTLSVRSEISRTSAARSYRPPLASSADHVTSAPKRLTRTARLARLGVAQRRFPFRDAAAIERAQARRVARIAEHAYQHVPHYREQMDRLGLGPRDLRSGSDLARLPLIEREQVKLHPERFLSRALGPERIELTSSGTSGAPITVVWDRGAILAHSAYRQRQRAVLSSLGVPGLGQRETELREAPGCTDEIVQAARAEGLWLPRLLGNRQRLSIADSPAANLERMRRFDPHLVRSFGSYVESLFAALERSGQRPPSLKVAVVGGDSISEPARRRIEAVFGIPVLGSYGAIETLDIGFECEHRAGYHLYTDLCPVRVVGPNGEELPDGERGEVVISNLLNRGTVLLNYRLGDLGAMLPAPCRCGRNLPLLDLAHGRVSDWIALENGRRVHAIEVRLCAKEDPEVWQFRIVQPTQTQVEVHVVPIGGADRESLRGRISERLSPKLGAGMEVEVRFVDHLPQDETGKRQEVVSHIAQREVAPSARRA